MNSEQDDNKITNINDCQGKNKTTINYTRRNNIEEEITSAEKVEITEKKEEVTLTEKKKTLVMATPVAIAKEPPKCRKNGCCCAGRCKLEVYDWLRDIPAAQLDTQMVEVQFKNTRKSYYLNSNNLEINVGDIVAVEATPGHDIGEVTLTGKLVQLQMKKNNFRGEVKRVYRLAKPNDIDKSNEAKAKEPKTMLRAREIAENLKLDMKISDVEYQGDGNKAIFYYIADGRVDFRQLIKDYASEFHIKIEMKQIGARQEAGRVGGIGPCGRELCCSSSMSNFISVSTSAARLQDIPLNPQKLAGQCGKLKCCLNFEVDTYVEAQRKLPPREAVLDTKDNSYYLFKTDVLSGMMTYSTDKNFGANLVTIPKDRVFEIIRMNKNGKKPLHLTTDEEKETTKPTSFDVLEQENINRFDNDKKNRKKKKKKKGANDNIESSNPVNPSQVSPNKKEIKPNVKAENTNSAIRQDERPKNNNNKFKRKNNNNRPRNNNGKSENQKTTE